MLSVRFHRALAGWPGARLVVLTLATILVTACAAPGAVSTPSPAPTSAASASGTQASTAPSAVAAGPGCGTSHAISPVSILTARRKRCPV